ncbi:RNA-directed DNA polymerase, eukaryota [Tanacetum coccineum]
MNPSPLSSNGLPTSPPYELYPADSSPIVDFVKPTPDDVYHKPNSLDDIPNLNIPHMVSGESNHDDVELDELLCSFQRISNSAHQYLRGKEKKQKHKKKELILGGGASSQEALLESVDEETTMKNIGAHIDVWWNNHYVEFSYVFCGSKICDRNVLGVIGSWTGISSKVGLLNVYAPQSSTLKDELWNTIEGMINSFDAIWIIFGDFNVVRCHDERVGSSFDARDANSFNEFVARVGLFDFPLGGKRFTRFDKYGKKASKLDRFLGLPNSALKPYRIFDKWIGGVELKEVIAKSWASNPFFSTPNVNLKNKLKKLRLDIKAWTTNRICLQNKVKDDLIRQSGEWDVKSENGLINERDVSKREEWIMDLNQLDQIHRDDLKKKCRLRWAAEGDENTRFKENVVSRPCFSSPLFCKSSYLDASYLETSISMEEIKEAVWSCARSKALCKLANGCNPSFIVFIPKMTDPLSFSDYRPISLIGCVYKVISNILANRLAKVISSVISPNQSAFLVGRQILDGCLIANEIIRTTSIENLKLLLFKVYFEKAFDSVNWDFLLDACNKGFYKGIFLANCGSNISLLQYADDALFFGEWSRVNAMNLIRILKCFEFASGLKVNIMKSRIMGVGVPHNDVTYMASSLGCVHDSIPFSYLGLPFGKRMRSCDGWNDIINRFRDRLSSWKANSLSIGGRLTLVKSRLEADSFGALKNRVVVLAGLNGIPSSLIEIKYGSGQRLCDKFPRLYALEIDKDCKVSERWHHSNNEWCSNWSWRIVPRGRAIDDLLSLTSIIKGLKLDPNDLDKWFWTGDVSGKFKVNICVWKASLNKLPTRDNLVQRGVYIASSCCPLCGSVVEDIEHCTIRCPWVVAIWKKVWSWWCLKPPVYFPSFSIADIASCKIHLDGCARINKVLQGVFLCAFWSIWKWRNKVVNADLKLVASIVDEDIFPSIQRLSKLWIFARIKPHVVNWSLWISRPFNLFS